MLLIVIILPDCREQTIFSLALTLFRISYSFISENDTMNLNGGNLLKLVQQDKTPVSLIPFSLKSESRVLIMTAVSAERAAVLRGLKNDKRFDVLLAGVGSVVAAVNTAKALASAEYGLVISAGIGGGFAGRAEVGSLVVANDIVVADLGAETAEGFSSLEELGFGFTRVQTDTSLVEHLYAALLAAKLPVNIGRK